MYISPVCFERSTGMPLPWRRKRRPDWVPSGTFTRVWLPSMVGTSISPPNAARTMEIGTRQYKSAPSRWKNGCAPSARKNVEIPGGSTAHARLAFAREPYAGAILDARGDVDRERALARHPPGARAGWARVVDDLSAALAGGAGPLEREETLGVTDASLTAASGTSL